MKHTSSWLAGGHAGPGLRAGRLAGLLAAAALLAAACGGGGSGATTKEGLDVVTAGTVGGSSADAAMFVAIDKGYFKEQGIKVELQRFDSGARMVAPLGSGQLDVGSGGISAGLFNAIADGVKLRIVADKAREVPPDYTSLVVRKELVDSGKYQDYSDLKGLRVAVPAKGVVTGYVLDAMLKKGGLGFDDIRLEEIGFADQIPALANGSIDAAISIEPSTTKAIEAGAAQRVGRGTDVLGPHIQSSGILYSDAFTQQKDLATRYMTAYLKGVRFYNDALDNGRLKGSKGDEVAQSLVKNTAVDDPEFYKKIALHGVDPDGEPNLDSVRSMLQFFQTRKLLDSDVDIDAVMGQAFDSSIREAVVGKLGPYEGPADYKAE